MSEQKIQKQGYEITVKGEYYSSAGRDKFVKIFSPETFFLPEVVRVKTGLKKVKVKVDGKETTKIEQVFSNLNALNCAQHVIQKQLLPIRLAEKYPDFSSIRLCHIVDQKKVTRSTASQDELESLYSKKIKDMTLSELKQYVSLEGLGVPIASYASLADARKATQDAVDDLKLAKVRNQVKASPQGQESKIEGGTDGVKISEGAITSADGVPIDEESELESLL